MTFTCSGEKHLVEVQSIIEESGVKCKPAEGKLKKGTNEPSDLMRRL